MTYSKKLYLLAASLCLAGCGGVSYTPDLSLLENFDRTYFPKEVSTLSDTVDLFVDYSTCVAEAKNSDYYKATHPSIVDCSPVFWSIKGDRIKKETTDRQMVYQLLSNITEVNHADIKQAVRQIVDGNHQAVLITDGEYYRKGAVRDNLNNPYLAEEFRTWLGKGYDIYIYSEPYRESGRYDKHRYYMLFTDAELDNNINDRYTRSIPASNNVKMLHLSDGIPALKVIKDYPDINEAVSPVKDNCKMAAGFELQEYGMGWSDIKDFLDTDDISLGYVTRGLFVEKSESDCYRITELKPVVYQVYDAYQEYCDSTYAEGSIPSFRKLRKVEDVFEIDEDIFEETGEIVLKLDDDFDGVGDALSSETPNLLKVDFVIDEAEDNFSGNEELNAAYKWNSISAAQGHSMNTSVYESIAQVIRDPQMNPSGKGKVIYTIYISSARI